MVENCSPLPALTLSPQASRPSCASRNDRARSLFVSPRSPHRTVLKPLSNELISLHSRNAGYLQQLETRLSAAEEQREEWAVERAALLEAAERKDASIARLHDTLQMHRERERAVRQQIYAYQVSVVSVRDEWKANLLAAEQRECQLRVDMDEWREALEQEKQAGDALRAQLQAQSSELEQRSAAMQGQQNEISNLQQQLVDLQQEMMQASNTDDTDSAGRPEGHTARPRPAASTALRTFPFPFPFPLSASSLSPSTVSTAASPSEYPYEELVELHETAHSLGAQLTAASSAAEQWRRRAAASEEREAAMAEELAALRLMCGNEDEVQRWRAEQQRQARDEMRQWRRQQEEQIARQVSEREKAATERRAEDEQREAQTATDAVLALRSSLGLARELRSLWQTASGDGGVVARHDVPNAASLADVSASLQSELSAFHQQVLDKRARQVMEHSNGQCTIQ